MSDNLDVRDIDEIVEATGRGEQFIIPILHRIQDKYNYLPETALRRVCDVAGVSPASIDGISSFYSRFRRQPAGRKSR